jgi:hypothetical protein
MFVFFKVVMKNLGYIVVIILLACNNNSTQHTASKDTSTATANNESKNLNSNSIGNDLTNDTVNAIPHNPDSDKIIVPGERIGKAILNTNADNLEQLFGKPDFSDAAMGKAWLTWYGKKPDEHNNKTELDIYTAYKDTSMREKSVQQIRTTSSYFSTENNIHVYSSLEEIRKAFPQIQKIKQNKNDARKFIVYDDVNAGIAFEIVTVNNQHICTAIFVHPKDKKVTDIYIASPS